jgi:hypothetical protein
MLKRSTGWLHEDWNKPSKRCRQSITFFNDVQQGSFVMGHGLQKALTAT